MQKTLICCQMSQKDEIVHILKVNNYIPTVFVHGDDIILLLELHDCQMNLLIELIHKYMKSQDNKVYLHVCHQISFYD